MTRVLGLLILLAVGVAAVLAVIGGSQASATYRVELDNAFGLETGSEVHIAGVLDGAITATALDPKTGRALLTFRLNEDNFGGLRSDVSCDVRLQSLIGDYYLDCRPGLAPRRLPSGAVIPVTHTTETIPIDLIENIQRDPYRQRLRILIDELGTAAAGNGQRLNAAIRRFVPALRETDAVLGTLASERHVIARLTTNADILITALARNRQDVGRWVRNSVTLTSAAAAQHVALAEGFAKLPGFLQQLTPTMGALQQAAQETTPALRRLAQAAPATSSFLNQLSAFADAGGPAIHALGQAGNTGRPAMQHALSLVRQLGLLAPPAADVAGNLAIILEHLNSPAYAVENNPQSPGGHGFTGLQAPLQWLVNIGLATNTYTRNAHFEKGFALVDPICQGYNDAQRAQADYAQCNGWLGPTQPGVLTPDPTAIATKTAARRYIPQGHSHAHPGGSPGTASAGLIAQPAAAPNGRSTMPSPVPSPHGLLNLLGSRSGGPPPTMSALLRYLLAR